MNPLALVVDDLLKFVGPDGCRQIFSVDEELEFRTALLLDILAHEVELPKYLGEVLGVRDLLPLLQGLGLSTDPRQGSTRRELPDLIQRWLGYRGIVTSLAPAVCPQKLLNALDEKIAQASGDQEKYDAAKIVAPELERLVRCLALYFLQGFEPGRRFALIAEGLRKGHESGSLARNSAEDLPKTKILKSLEALSLAELCWVLDELALQATEPCLGIGPSVEAVNRGTSLVRLAGQLRNKLLHGRGDAEQGRSYCALSHDVLEEWRASDVVPCGAVVYATTETALGRRFECRDEVSPGNSVQIVMLDGELALNDSLLLPRRRRSARMLALHPLEPIRNPRAWYVELS